MSDSIRVHNPNAREVVYDTAGHIVAGCSSVQADLNDPVTARLVGLERLIVPVEPVPEVAKSSSGKTTATKSGD